MYLRTLPYRRGLGDGASAAAFGAGSLISGGISAAVGLATSAVGLWMGSIQLSHNADTATTQIVNGLEPLLNANKNAYLAGPRTCLDQAAALAAFDSAFLWLQSPKACGAYGYGSAGNRCITDRAPGGKWDWTAMYRTPIANDQTCATDGDSAEQSAIANIQSLISGNYQQTTPGQFVGSGGGPVSGSSSVDLSGVTIPSWVWAVAAAALVVMVIK